MGKAKRFELIAADGTHLIRLVWLRIRRGPEIHGSIFHPSIAMHRSYHSDGTVHWKADWPTQRLKDGDKFFKETGYSRHVDSGPPLRRFTGYFSFLQGGFRLDADCFERLSPYKFTAVVRVLLVDSRAIKGPQRHINYYLDLVEVGAFKILNARMEECQRIFRNADMVCEHHCYLEFEPWVLMSIAYSSQ